MTTQLCLKIHADHPKYKVVVDFVAEVSLLK